MVLRNPERCPSCGGESRVADTRPGQSYRWRQRACLACTTRWETFESLIDPRRVRPKPQDIGTAAAISTLRP
jgi:transcriptional regulator NrdR family protein